MANSKGYVVRQRVLDKCLHSIRGYSTAEMMDACNFALQKRGYRKITASNTVRDDLLEIENAYGVTIEKVLSGRNIRYRYKDASFSIYSSPLTDKDLDRLQELLNDLESFQGRPQFEWLDDISERLHSTLGQSSADEKFIVEFDENKQLKGREFFEPLFNAIKNQQALNISYKSFNRDEEVSYTIHPYFVKQYNKRWFLFARRHGYKTLTNFSLDRIVCMSQASIPYEQNEGDFDFKAFFKDIVGVSIPRDGNVVPVRIWVSNELYPYIATKPIHHTQTLVSEEETGKIIEINVIPNYELKRELLSHCESVKVLSPPELQKELIKKIEKNLENYQ